MKTGLLTLILLIFSTSASAATEFLCLSPADDGHFVKKAMKLRFIDGRTVAARLYDSSTKTWLRRSTGRLQRQVAMASWARFSGFKSSELFGERADGLADKGISLYISPAVLSGTDGEVSLYAQGSVPGLETASYFCKSSPSRNARKVF